MSNTTNEINKVTGTIIRVSWKLIVYAVIVLAMYEGISRGYQFGHDIFYSSGMASKPGVDMRVTIGEGEKVADIGAALEKGGLIKDKFAFVIQSIFYDYGGSEHPVEAGTYILNNSMTSKEIILILREGAGDGKEGTEE
ncbi:MAG: endolytic transglycosylase MltG [Hungatella sp.]|nr:endolytic transglycosylase MltG [Hungatella sp.]